MTVKTDAAPLSVRQWARKCARTCAKAWPSVLAVRTRWLVVVATIGLTGALFPLVVRQAHGNRKEVAWELAAVALVLALTTVASRALRLQRSVAVACASGMALRLAYLFVTPSSVRTHDVDEHVQYIEYIVDHHALPDPTAGWAFYHPPLYFAMAAVLWWTLKLVGVTAKATILRALQCQSLAYGAGYLGFSLLAADRWLDRLPDARLGTRATRWRLALIVALLLSFWPSAITHSVRVGNDDLFYLFFGGGLYFLTRWWQDARNRDLHLTAACAGLATLAKSNGVLLFVVLGLLFGVRVLLDRDRSVRAYLRRTWPSMVMFLVSVGATLGRSAVGVLTGKRHHLVVENADLVNPKLAVGNGAANYIWFDTKMFVTHPFADVWGDDGGRQYFWNELLKTGVLGEFGFDGGRLADLAVVLSALLLVLVAFAVAGVAWEKRSDRLDELPLVLTVVVSTASLAALRMSIPKACSNDFRYILPILMPALCLYARALVRAREAGRVSLARWGEAAGWSFAALSATFFVVLAKG